MHDLIRARLYEQAGLSVKPRVSIEQLRETEWSPEFEQLMRNRLVMGAIRYGKLHAPGKSQYDRIASCIKRLKAYEETGNKEYLVDVANLCLLEFEECHHPKQHFAAIDDSGHVGRVEKI
jgi:hypothetical protein